MKAFASNTRFLSKVKRFTSVLISLLFVSSSFAGVNLDVVSDTNKYKKTIDFIEQMGSDIYCYWDVKKEQFGVEWKKVISDARNKISDETSFEQFQEILTNLASSLHDGHVNYIFNSNKLFYVPIKVKAIGEQYYIARVDSDKIFPNNVDLSAGDKLLAVDGQNINEYINRKSQYISGSTLKAINSKAAESINSLEKFKTAPQNTLNLTIEKFTTGEVKDIELPWLIYDREADTQEKRLSDIVSSKILPGNIGVLTLTQMYHENGLKAHIDYIKQELTALKNTRALIIDVRDNGGGYGEIGDSIIAHLILKPMRRYQIQLKNSMQVIYARPELLDVFAQVDPNTYHYSEWQDVMISPVADIGGVASYDKPVYILANERCFSACDTFVDSFSSNKLGEVLGAQTGGGTGYPLWIELPWNYGNFRFSVLRGYSNHGRYLEGTGTIPDVEIQKTPSDLYNNIDGELIKAYRYVINKLNISHPFKKNENSASIMANFTSKTSAIVPYHVEEEYRQNAQRHF
jgi:carboxyl-terminal processing protease